jgi:putative transposase
MPWEPRCVVSLREEFVGRARSDGCEMTSLCEEFGISRKTGYKWLKRFDEAGLVGLENMSRRPSRSPLEVPAEVALEVVLLRRQKPRWGPKKLRAALLRTHAAEDVPSERTIDRILSRCGEPRRQRPPDRTVVKREFVGVDAKASNDVWTVDFKGWWRTLDGAQANPLTIRDGFSRYVLAIELLESSSAAAVHDVFERLFHKHGRPRAIQSDNGSPFACTSARGGLSRLSAWWASLGIKPVFSRPGHPQDNGAHERMHLDMRFDLEDKAEADLSRQQAACERWRHDFNHHRPHEALDQRVPADVYRSSPRKHRKEARLFNYPAHWITRRVTSPGRISIDGRHAQVSSAVVGYSVGLEPLENGEHRVWHFDHDLGTLNLATDTRAASRVTSSWAAPEVTPAARKTSGSTKRSGLAYGR